MFILLHDGDECKKPPSLSVPRWPPIKVTDDIMPDLKNKILFLEDDNIVGDYFRYEFDRNLQSLIQTSGIDGVKGIVFGRFEDSCKMDINTIRKMISTKKQLKNIPIISNVDFGHEFPFVTLPIGGVVKDEANASKVSLKVVEH